MEETKQNDKERKMLYFEPQLARRVEIFIEEYEANISFTEAVSILVKRGLSVSPEMQGKDND